MYGLILSDGTKLSQHITPPLKQLNLLHIIDQYINCIKRLDPLYSQSLFTKRTDFHSCNQNRNNDNLQTFQVGGRTAVVENSCLGIEQEHHGIHCRRKLRTLHLL